MSTKRELVELYGGPHDGERLTMQVNSYEVHVPKPLVPVWHIAEPNPLNVEPVHRDVYQFCGYSPRTDLKMFKWSYEI